MTVLWLVIAALATWRIASLIGSERGPFAIGTHLREGFGVRHKDDGTPDYYAGEVLLRSIYNDRRDDLLHEIARGITCIWCCSMWVGIGMALVLTAIAPALVFDVLSGLMVALALSAGAIAFNRVFG